MDVLIGWPGGDWQATAKLVGYVVGGYLGIIWLASIVWTYRDISSRTRDPISQLVGVAIAVTLPLVGLPVYLVLRPSDTLQANYDRRLEQEAILSDLHAVSVCPNCRRPVQDDFMVCPHCRTGLKEPCADCGQLLLHAWQFCPHCATPHERAREASRLDFGGELPDEQAQPAQPAPPAQPAQAAATTIDAPTSIRPRRPAGEEPEPAGR